MTWASKGLLPSMAIKFLVDGVGSENLLGMPSFTGEDENGEMSWDFFRDPFKNRVERLPEGCMRDSIEKKMLEGTTRPYTVGIAGPAQVTNEGEIIDVICEDGEQCTFPFELHYEGTHHFANDRDEEWYKRI